MISIIHLRTFKWRTQSLCLFQSNGN